MSLRGVVAAVSLLLTCLAACGDAKDDQAATDGPVVASGCEPQQQPIVENTAFIRYEDRLSHSPLVDEPIQLRPVSGNDQSPYPERVEGQPLIGVDGNADTTGTAYYSENTSEGWTYDDFVDGGGFTLTVSQLGENADVVGGMKTDFSDRTVEVRVGSFTAALTWADPGPSGTRPHHVIWQDGPAAYELVGNVDAESIVTAARSIVC